MIPTIQVDRLTDSATRTNEKALAALLGMQSEEGYWWAELTADSTLESDWILLQLWLHPPVDGVWNPPTRPQIDKAVQSILSRQLPDGGFYIYPKGPSEVSASVKAYFALKLAGVPADSVPMTRLRDRILALGGIQSANSYVRLNLSLFDLYPREGAPSVPPEIMLLGRVIYEMSSWTRTIVIPLSIVQALNTGRPVPEGFDLNELFIPGKPATFQLAESLLSLRNVFLAVDKGLKIWEKIGVRRVRQRAIKRAEKWMLEHTKRTDGLGAIYPPMMYIIMALDLLGYPPDHPERAEAQRQFDRLMVERGDDFYFQPCFSVVWDTAIAAFAAGESQLAPKAAMQRCGDWLLSKEVRQKGDWSVKRPNIEPSGWYFEFANEFYPDIDDTAMVLLALYHTHASNSTNFDSCVKRALNWLVGMQSKDGGWAAFDVDNDWEVLSKVPFADHNAMLDPTCPDITGRVLEAFVLYGFESQHPVVRRGVDYLKRTQEADGSWYGRWGVDYIYGTFLALRGLRSSGESDREAYILRAGEWLRSIQNADGGWGESCESYDRNTFVPAASTASQTAWAILGLLASGDTTSESLRRGIEYLVANQKADGTWDEDQATGTGFPRVFYLTYHLYRQSFPVLALSTYLKSENGME
jgi:squalene-hopene/tetraprenyl-beta-curcumene cyclase